MGWEEFSGIRVCDFHAIALAERITAKIDSHWLVRQ
jgi:hypothetical protein